MIYILKFNPAFKHAKYYIGYCKEGNLQKRFQHHLNGRGATITRAARRQGHNLEIVATIPKGDRTLERRLKRQKNTPRIVKQLSKGKSK